MSRTGRYLPIETIPSKSILQLQTNHYETKIKWVNGRRCLFVPSRNSSKRNEISSDFLGLDNAFIAANEDTSSSFTLPLPPILILGGMSQSISSWDHHLTTLSKDRDVFIIEYLGSGLGYRHPDYQTQSLENSKSIISEFEYYGNVTLAFQAHDIESILKKVFPTCQRFDVIAFSLGARITLATIASFPELFRKVALTGVSLDRTPFGKVVIDSWKEILRDSVANNNSLDNSCLKTFAWSIIMATYSQSFLGISGTEKIKKWVDHICLNNNPIGLLRLVEQTHGDSHSPNEMFAIVEKIKMNQNEEYMKNFDSTTVSIHIGEMDCISSLEQACALNSMINKSESIIAITKYEGGHAVMNEKAGRIWRKNVLDYLNDHII